MSVKDSALIREVEIVDAPPKISYGEVLEFKQGQTCWRWKDEVRTLEGGKYEITRTWLRPGPDPFDPVVFGFKQRSDGSDN